MLTGVIFSHHSPTGYIHIPQVLIRFARKEAEFLRSSNLLVEFWKHCLNLLQYGIIDAECLKVCMGIVKGNQWSSVGQSELGIGLAGPLALDSGPIRPPQPERDKMDVDEDEGRKTAMHKRPKTESRGSGFCVCGMPFEKPEMVLCVGLVSKKNFLFPAIIRGIATC